MSLGMFCLEVRDERKKNLISRFESAVSFRHNYFFFKKQRVFFSFFKNKTKRTLPAFTYCFLLVNRKPLNRKISL